VVTSETVQQLRLQEPLESPFNQAVWARYPSLETPETRRARESHVTYYQVFHGPGAAFEGRAGVPVRDFTDGTAHTFLIAEAAEPVHWTEPADLSFGPSEKLPELGGLFPDVFLAAFADGSVKPVPRGIPEATLRAYITRNGGEHVP
jgi:hypothetical protein